MSEHLILLDTKRHWKPEYPQCPIASAREYIGNPEYAKRRGLRVINLCRNQSYLSLGYYCSLLAEARGHRVMPGVRTLQDLSRKSIYSLSTANLDRKVHRIIQRRKQSIGIDRFVLPVIFGLAPLKDMQPFARELFESFPMPLLRAEFELHEGVWRIDSIRPMHLPQLPPEQEGLFLEGLERHLSGKWRSSKSDRRFRHDLAILHNPDEELPPSDKRALQHFVRAARSLDINAELIQAKDYGRLLEYDALFIRETTNIDHHTYRFARKAAKAGMVVIDDPDSILRCTNKIYLAELLAQHRIATPKTAILREDNLEQVEAEIPYPIVLKIPDGSFSRGVFKVEDRRALCATAKRLFKESDLLLAQEFTYTEFDWRVGILNREAIYVCQYFMSGSHWQIVDHSAKGGPREGGFRTLAVADAPPRVVETALRAAHPIGNGLYGVDLKETAKGILVIEVNDNPSLDAGVEDKVLKSELYLRVMREFLRRLEEQGRRRGG